jgi:hypothetical protein
MQIFFAVGLLLTFATAAMWVRGFWWSDYFFMERGWIEPPYCVGQKWTLGFERQRIGLALHERRLLLKDSDAREPARYSHLAEPADAFYEPRRATATAWGRLGFRFNWSLGPNEIRQVAAPLWLVCVICCAGAAAPGHILWRQRRARRRLKRGLCPACGYDLRGAAHERCPECGAAVV